ncbi:MAG: hypothetical protein KGI41_03345 [Patescibacteria group bacterium]|nr:hypothetical protein [Patescibacteria group bacterium]MDE1966247.1 hypothetical protein [Patescibacteria group bacterium]
MFGKLFKSWKSIRWMVWFVCLAIDGVIFYLSDPFTAESFVASGTAAAVMFILVWELCFHYRGRGRIKAELEPGERVTYQVGLHLFELLKRIRAHRLAARAIYIPLWFAAAASFFWMGWLLWRLGVSALSGAYAFLPENKFLPLGNGYVCALYLPLLFSIPFVLECVLEYRSRQYALVVDEKSGDPQLTMISGFLEFDVDNISLAREVSLRAHQSFWDTLVAIGDVTLHETSGGQKGESIERIWRPRRFEQKLNSAIKVWRRKRLHEET